MDEIKEDLRAIRSDVTNIRVDVARNTISLDTHIKRTDLLEKIVLMIVGAIVVAVLGGVIKLLIS